MSVADENVRSMEDGRRLHRDGGMIAGGDGYPVLDLQNLPELPSHDCGIGGLNELAGGMTPGSVWTLAAPTTTGVTSLSVQLAVAASRTATVTLANGHMTTHLLRDRVLTAAQAAELEPMALRRVHLASWLPVPRLDDDLLLWGGRTPEVVVLDTVDEMFRPPAWPDGFEERLRQLRWLRELAQRSGSAVLLTSRVAGLHQAGWQPFNDAWSKHWAHPVFADIADVRLELWTEEHWVTFIRAYIRGRGWWQGRHRRRGHDQGFMRFRSWVGDLDPS